MRPVVLMWVQHHVTGAAFLGHSHCLVIHSQLTQKVSSPEPYGSAWAPTPLLPGPSFPCPLQGHQELPPAWGRLSVLSLGGFVVSSG